MEKEIEFNLKQEPLRLDEIEATPTYLKKPEKKKAEKKKEEQTYAVEKKDAKKKLIIKIDGLTRYE